MDLTTPKIMGILNVTPDSFSDGGTFLDPKAACERVSQLIAEGADIVDIGGQSTGPDSKNVPLKEELARVKPVINFIAKKKLAKKAVFSIDTYKSEVAAYALKNGFKMVNDVTAVRGDPKMVKVLLKYKPYVVIMYSKDRSPRTTTHNTQYADVIATIKEFLKERIAVLIKAGIPKDKIIIDPGMGMFVSADPKYSFQIMDRLEEFKSLGHPMCVGVSRKSFLSGNLKERDYVSIEYSKKAISKGARIVRIHDVKNMKRALAGH